MLLKIFGTVAVAVIAWLILTRMGSLRGAKARQRPSKAQRAVELAPCPRCGAYVQMGALCDCASRRER